MNLAKRLQQIVIFKDCTQDELWHISRSSVQRRFNQGEILLKENDLATALYVVLEGSVQVFTKEREGTTVLLARLNEDDYFGEQAYLNNLTRTVSVKALTDVVVIEIHYDLLDPLFQKSPKLQNFFHKSSLARSLANLQLQLSSIDTYVKKEIFTHSAKTFMKFYKKDAAIFINGDSSKFVYFITSGLVSLKFEDNDSPASETLLHKNHVFGEIGVLHGQERAATARAKANTALIVVSGVDFLDAVKQSLGFRNLMITLSETYMIPMHKAAIDHHTGKHQGDDALFIKYKLPSNKIAVYCRVVAKPIISLNVFDTEPDIVLEYKDELHYRKIIIKNNLIIGVVSQGDWSELDTLCEMVLDEITITHAIMPEVFASTGNLLL